MSHAELLWVVDDDRSIRWVLENTLLQAGYRVRCFEQGEALLEALQHAQPRLILSDIRMPGRDGLALLAELRSRQQQLPVIIMTAHADLDSAVASYQGGAFEYLPKPFDLDDLLLHIRRALQQRPEPAERAPAALPGSELIGEAPAMQELFRIIGRLSQSSISVLLTGASGTGKERVAHALHRHSPRAGRPFVALNMAAIPRELIESELFGHERGAFSGATGLRHGRFAQADGGTLFLDEIGDMPADSQTRLLRVLANGEFYRVGGHSPLRADVRIIAATHQPLEQLVERGHFRADLYHRLNVIRIPLPALTERREDIPALARHFLTRAAREQGSTTRHLSSECLAWLQQLPWPGNVRQLENTCRWLSVMAASDEVQIHDLPAELQPGSTSTQAPPGDWQKSLKHWAQQALATGQDNLLEQALPAFERCLIEAALEHSGGRRNEAASLLGWGRNTLTRKLEQHRR